MGRLYVCTAIVAYETTNPAVQFAQSSCEVANQLLQCVNRSYKCALHCLLLNTQQIRGDRGCWWGKRTVSRGPIQEDDRREGWEKKWKNKNK